MEGSIAVDQWIRYPPTKREIAGLEPAASETSFCLQQILSQEVVSSWQMTVDGGVDVTVGRIVTCHITVTVDVVLNLIALDVWLFRRTAPKHAYVRFVLTSASCTQQSLPDFFHITHNVQLFFTFRPATCFVCSDRL